MCIAERNAYPRCAARLHMIHIKQIFPAPHTMGIHESPPRFPAVRPLFGSLIRMGNDGIPPY